MNKVFYLEQKNKMLGRISEIRESIKFLEAAVPVAERMKETNPEGYLIFKNRLDERRSQLFGLEVTLGAWIAENGGGNE